MARLQRAECSPFSCVSHLMEATNNWPSNTGGGHGATGGSEPRPGPLAHLEGRGAAQRQLRGGDADGGRKAPHVKLLHKGQGASQQQVLSGTCSVLRRGAVQCPSHDQARAQPAQNGALRSFIHVVKHVILC